MKLHGSVLVVVLSFTAIVVAQVEPPPPVKEARQISGGVLNGKAVSLPKPAYPPAAREVNAEGAVTVQILIDENGLVVSANAISGHPLLRPAAVEAAKNAVFSPTNLSGMPVKVSGVITYNFVGITTMSSIGYELAIAERSGSFAPYVNPKSLASRLPENMASEKAVLAGLVFELPVQTDPPTAKSPPDATQKDDKRRFTVIGASAISHYDSGKLTQESLDALRNLQTNIRAKLAADPRNEWHFRVGTALGVFAADIKDEGRTAQNAAEIEFLAGTAPSSVSQTLIEGLTKLVELARTSDGTPEARQMLVSSAQRLRNIRIH